jgi:hypothetical protein
MVISIKLSYSLSSKTAAHTGTETKLRIKDNKINHFIEIPHLHFRIKRGGAILY